METSLCVPYAILFVYDSTNKNAETPKYMQNILTAANENCISIGTQADVDGEVVVKLKEKSITPGNRIGLSLVFKGEIRTPGNKITIGTAELKKILEKSTKGQRTEVCVWVDNLKGPSIIVVEAE